MAGTPLAPPALSHTCRSHTLARSGAATPAVVVSCIPWNGSLTCFFVFVLLFKGQITGRCNENEEQGGASTLGREKSPWRGQGQAWSRNETVVKRCFAPL